MSHFWPKLGSPTQSTQFDALWLCYAKWAQLQIRQSTVHCLNLLDMSEVATTSVISVLVILKIPRVHNYNHSNPNRMFVLIWCLHLSVMRYVTHTKNSAWLNFFFTGLARLDLVEYQICTSLPLAGWELAPPLPSLKTKTTLTTRLLILFFFLFFHLGGTKSNSTCPSLNISSGQTVRSENFYSWLWLCINRCKCLFQSTHWHYV